MWRVDDAIRKYQPDMIYFDDHAGDSQMDLGVNMGIGRLTPQILADFYNIAAKRTEGRRGVVATFKGVGGRYNSFQNSPELLPLVDRSLVKSTEFFTEDQIMAFPFQTEVSLQEWHFKPGAPYHSASDIVLRLMQNVSRNGSLLLNITQRGRGDIEEQALYICQDIGRWIKMNGEAVYGTRPFDVWGDEHCLYTRKDGNIYVTLVDWDGSEITLAPLSSDAASVGKISKVTLLGGKNERIKFKQTPEGLVISSKNGLNPVEDMRDTALVNGFRVLKIKHDKAWFNDDDPGVSTLGWDRRCNLEDGSFNNDLYFSDRQGDVWQASYYGKRIAIIAPMGKEYGEMQVVIDGKDCGTVNLYSPDEKSQQKVFSFKNSKRGNHLVQLVCAKGTVSVDALIIK